MNRWVEANGIGVVLLVGAGLIVASVPLSNPAYLMVGAALVIVAAGYERLRRLEAGRRGIKLDFWRTTTKSIREQPNVRGPQPNAGHPGAQPTVTGKDADVLRRVADALDAAPPASPAEFVHALAQAVAAVVSNPTLILGRSDQLGGDITITEIQPGQMANGSRFTISVDSPGVAFSRPPWATVNRSDLKLRAGPASATSVAAQMADDRQLAEWTVVSPSTTLGIITISALFFDVAPDAPAGPLRVTVRFADSEHSLVVGVITAAE